MGKIELQGEGLCLRVGVEMQRSKGASGCQRHIDADRLQRNVVPDQNVTSFC